MNMNAVAANANDGYAMPPGLDAAASHEPATVADGAALMEALEALHVDYFVTPFCYVHGPHRRHKHVWVTVVRPMNSAPWLHVLVMGQPYVTKYDVAVAMQYLDFIVTSQNNTLEWIHDDVLSALPTEDGLAACAWLGENVDGEDAGNVDAEDAGNVDADDVDGDSGSDWDDDEVVG
jgi:hypothetical protein